MNIYLVRHADYEKQYHYLKGRLPVKLSTLGVSQANNLCEFFKDIQIDKIYSSAVLRCKETSEIIADSKIKVLYDKRLLETLSAYQGYAEDSWENLAYSQTDELGGEKIRDVYNRIVAIYQEVLNLDCENVIICSHGDPLYFLYIYLIKGEISEDYKKLRTKYPEYQSKASIRLVEVENNTLKNQSVVLTQEELND